MDGLVNNEVMILDDSIVKEYKLPSNTVRLAHKRQLDEKQESMVFKHAPKLSKDSHYPSSFNKMKVCNQCFKSYGWMCP